MSRPTGGRSAICADLWEVRMLPCKYKQRSLAVLSLIMEAVSILLDKYDKQLLAVIAAFLLAVVGFAISIFPGIKTNARLRNAKQDQVVQFVLSLIQFSAAFWQLVQTVSNEEDKINFSIYFPLAIATIAVIFALIKKPRQSDSQSGSLPLINPPRYNSVPCSPDSGSDEIRISIGEENELFARTLNNSAPGSTPVEPDGHNGISADEENVESPLTSSEPATLPGSTPIELDGQSRINIDAENFDFVLTSSESATLPGIIPIETDGYIEIFTDEGYGDPPTPIEAYQAISTDFNLMRKRNFEKLRGETGQEEMRSIFHQLKEARARLKKLGQEIGRLNLQEGTITERQDRTSKPYKKIAHLRNMKRVTKPVANVARPSATLRRRGKRSI